MLQNQRYFISKSYVLVSSDNGPLMETAWFIQGNVLPQINQVTKELKYTTYIYFFFNFRFPPFIIIISHFY